MKKESIYESYIYNLIYQVLAILAPFITTPYVSRVLGADGIGVYSYTSTIASYFSLFCALGTNVYGQQEIAKKQNDKLAVSTCFWEIMLIRIASTTICMVSFLVFSFNYKTYRTQLLIHSIQIVAQYFDLSWLFQGLEKFKLVAIRNIVIKFLSIICIFVFVKKPEDINIYILCIVASMLIGNVSYLGFAKEYLTRPRLSTKSIKNHLAQVWIFFIPQIAYSLYGSIDKLMIGTILHSNYDNGYYEQAHKVIYMINSCLSGLNVIMRSKISFLHSNGEKEKVRYFINRSIAFFSMLAIPCVAGLILISDDFVPIFFGRGYSEVTFLLKMFAVSIYSTGLNSLLGIQYLTPIGLQKKCNRVLILTSIENILLNAFLIPIMGCRGAVVASVIAETTVAMFYLIMSRNIVGIVDLLKISRNYLMSSLGMVISIKVVSHIVNEQGNIISLISKVGTGCIVYAILILLLRDKEGINLFRKVTRRQ